MKYGKTVKMDRMRTFRYNFKALSLIEEELGMSIMAFLGEDSISIDSQELENLEKMTEKERDRKIKKIEKELEKKQQSAMMEKLTMKNIIPIIWAGLVHEDKNLTLDDTWSLADEYLSIPEMTQIAMNGLSQSFGNEGKEDNVGKVKND